MSVGHEELRFAAGVEGTVDPEALAQQRLRATRAVASAARDAAECAELLMMLGLRPAEGRSAVPGNAA
jgi:hypothetical protein